MFEWKRKSELILCLIAAGPLPRFDGFSRPISSPAQPSPTANITPQSTGGPIRVPTLTPEKVSEFSALFEKSGAQNGVLGGKT